MKPSLTFPFAVAANAYVTGVRSANAMPYECKTFTLPITLAKVSTVVLPFPALQNQYQATSLLNTITDRYQSSATPKLVNVSQTYDIAAQYCYPISATASSTLQILTHGIGFNASYWDFYLAGNQSDTQYSYINAATAAGHSTLSYNRLGIAGSTLANPYTEVQFTVELAILLEITTIARAGKIPNQQQAPAKVIHVGHSYGSELTNALAVTKPTLSDGIVLTGYSHISSYAALFAAATNFRIASDKNTTRFPPSDYSTGYITWPSKWSNQYGFFTYPSFAPAVLQQAEDTKQPFTVGEFVTQGTLGFANATAFTSPVLYVLGEQDLIFCGGNCTGLIGPGTPSYTAFNVSKDIQTVIVPGLGHGLNLHLNASGLVYSKINAWVAQHGF